MRILVVEDDVVLRDALVRTLALAGWRADPAGSVAAALEAVARRHYEVVVLDLGLPDGDGREVMQCLRRDRADTACLVTSARTDVETRVATLDAGADDFLAKPFSLDELDARVRRLVRRHAGERSARLPLGRIVVDLAAHRAVCDDVELELTPRDWKLLAWFACHPDETVSKERLAEAVASIEDAVSDNAVEVAVHRLRAKVEHCGVQIVAIRGLGYRVVATH